MIIDNSYVKKTCRGNSKHRSVGSNTMVLKDSLGLECALFFAGVLFGALTFLIKQNWRILRVHRNRVVISGTKYLRPAISNFMLELPTTTDPAFDEQNGVVVAPKQSVVSALPEDNMMFKSCGELENWLVEHKLSTENWESTPAKLYEELAMGKSEMHYVHTIGAIRVLHIVRVKVFRDNDSILMENQRLEDSVTSIKNSLVIKRHSAKEEPLVVGLKALRQRLCTDSMDKAAKELEVLGFEDTTHEMQMSESYAGLRTKYIISTLAVRMPGLPAVGFRSEDATDKDKSGNPVIHVWQWKTPAEVNELLEQRRKEVKPVSTFTRDIISTHTKDEARRYTYVSPACKAMLGYDEEELLGQSVAEFFHPDNKDLVRMQGGTMQYRMRKSDGTYLTVETAVSETEDAYIYSTRDVTERVAMEEEKAELERGFVAYVYHEIRNPFAGIVGGAEFGLSLLEDAAKQLEEGGEEGGGVITQLVADLSEELHTMLNSATHITGILDNVLDLSKLERNKLVLQTVPMNVHDVVHDAVSVLKRRAAPGVKLLLDVPKGVWIKGDPQRWKQVIINLLSNSLKFTKEGSVRVSVEANDNQLNVGVYDTGPGIPEDVGKSLFSKYRQGGYHPGTGLGLVISQMIVELMGGHIKFKSPWAEDESPGTVFYYTVPCDVPSYTVQRQRRKSRMVLEAIDRYVLGDEASRSNDGEGGGERGSRGGPAMSAHPGKLSHARSLRQLATNFKDAIKPKGIGRNYSMRNLPEKEGRGGLGMIRGLSRRRMDEDRGLGYDTTSLVCEADAESVGMARMSVRVVQAPPRRSSMETRSKKGPLPHPSLYPAARHALPKSTSERSVSSGWDPGVGDGDGEDGGGSGSGGGECPDESSLQSGASLMEEQVGRVVTEESEPPTRAKPGEGGGEDIYSHTTSLMSTTTEIARGGSGFRNGGIGTAEAGAGAGAGAGAAAAAAAPTLQGRLPSLRRESEKGGGVDAGADLTSFGSTTSFLRSSVISPTNDVSGSEDAVTPFSCPASGPESRRTVSPLSGSPLSGSPPSAIATRVVQEGKTAGVVALPTSSLSAPPPSLTPPTITSLPRSNTSPTVREDEGNSSASAPTGSSRRPSRGMGIGRMESERRVVPKLGAVLPDGLRVFCVDDEPMNLKIMTRKFTHMKPFKTMGVKVITAVSGEEALEKYESGVEFDVLVIDENMQRSGGVLFGSQTVARLRELGYTGICISCSGNCTSEDFQKYFQAGADHAWPKPFPKPDEIYKDLLALHLNIKPLLESVEGIKQDSGGAGGENV